MFNPARFLKFEPFLAHGEREAFTNVLLKLRVMLTERNVYVDAVIFCWTFGQVYEQYDYENKIRSNMAEIL